MRWRARRAASASQYFAIGERHTPSSRRPANTPDDLYGEGWVARRTPGGCFLEWDAGDLMSEGVTAEIPEADFEGLRSDPQSFRELWPRHEAVRVYSKELSAAVVAFLQWERSAFPRRDTEAARAAARKGDPDVLLGRVESLVRECGRIDVDWSQHDLAAATDIARAGMARRHPELDDAALDALAWQFSYGWK